MRRVGWCLPGPRANLIPEQSPKTRRQRCRCITIGKYREAIIEEGNKGIGMRVPAAQGLHHAPRIGRAISARAERPGIIGNRHQGKCVGSLRRIACARIIAAPARMEVAGSSKRARSMLVSPKTSRAVAINVCIKPGETRCGVAASLMKPGSSRIAPARPPDSVQAVAISNSTGTP